MAAPQDSGHSGDGLPACGLSRHVQGPRPRAFYTPGAQLAPSEERGQGSQACRAQSGIRLSSNIDITYMTDAGAPLLKVCY